MNFQPKSSPRHRDGRRGGDLPARIHPETCRWHRLGWEGMEELGWDGEWWQGRIGSERQEQSLEHPMELGKLFGCSWGWEGWVRVVCRCCSFPALLPKTCVQVGALGKGRSKNEKCPYQTKLGFPSAPTPSFSAPFV